jgi:hypothetical protein
MADSLGRIVVIAFVLVALLALLTTARYASTLGRRRVPSTDSAVTTVKPIKGDVRKKQDGALEYYDGRQWTSTPPPPRDDAF